MTCMKLRLDLYDIYNQGGDIGRLGNSRACRSSIAVSLVAHLLSSKAAS